MGNKVVDCCSEGSSTQASEDLIKKVRIRRKKERDFCKDKGSVSDSVQSHEPNTQDQGFRDQYGDYSRRNKVRSGMALQKSCSFKKKQKKFGLDNFQIRGVLGKGGFGVVYLAQLKSNIAQGKKEQYAIKCVFKELLQRKHGFEQAKDQKVIAMSGCDFIVPLVMSFQDQYRLYFVMQYAEGGDTFGLINANVSKFSDYMDLGEDAIRFIAGCVILGLQFIHNNGYMYRDLKPENILIFQNGYIKLTDFGLAKKQKIGVHSSTVTGTILYEAPEMVLKRGYDKKIDLWALGVFLYEMSNYCPPFQVGQIRLQTFEKVCLDSQKQRNWINPKVSPDLKDLIDKLLKLEPQQRLGAKDWNEIKSHPFFNNFDWLALRTLKMKSPLEEMVKKYPKQVANGSIPKFNTIGSPKAGQMKVQGWSFYGKYAEKIL